MQGHESTWQGQNIVSPDKKGPGNRQMQSVTNGMMLSSKIKQTVIKSGCADYKTAEDTKHCPNSNILWPVDG